MSRQLPSLNALRVFEAAARHLSFSRAAEELGVTQGAVSRQIKTLEDHLGMKLFRRLTRALELTEDFGLSGFENQYPFVLSGGMRQRTAFLRTILLNQDVILLDEPFGALDALTRVQMQEWLLDLWESLGKTIVLITHDVDEAILLSDRVYVLTARPGRITMDVEVDLPRPRNYKQVTEPEFAVLKAHLLEPLREESSRQAPAQSGRGPG